MPDPEGQAREPHDLLRLRGVEALRRVQVEEPGDTPFITGEQVERAEVLEENEKAEKDGVRGIEVDFRPGQQLRVELWCDYKLHADFLRCIRMLKR
jgi:hypothetical protein